MRIGGPILTALSLSLTQPRALMVATRRARPLCMKATDAGKKAASRAAVTPDSGSSKAVAKPKAAAKKASDSSKGVAKPKALLALSGADAAAITGNSLSAELRQASVPAGRPAPASAVSEDWDLNGAVERLKECLVGLGCVVHLSKLEIGIETVERLLERACCRLPRLLAVRISEAVTGRCRVHH